MKRKNNKKQNKDWLDWWLSDDEVAPAEIQSKMLPSYLPEPDNAMFDTTPQRYLATEPVEKNITVNVNLPKLKLPEVKKPDSAWVKQLPKRDSGRLAIIAVVAMLLGLGAHSFIFNSPPPAAVATTSANQVLAAATTVGANSPSQPAQTISLSSAGRAHAVGSTVNTSSSSAANQSGDKASFNPVSPSDKPELGQYAFAKTSYNKDTDTYTYVDAVNGSLISVSEQQANGYKNAQDAVNALATSVHATDNITTYAGTAHIYTDPSGKQTVIAPAAGLVIAINSQSSYGDAVWVAYLNNLR